MKPLGRPRSFDRDHALRSAMEVFWARGYEATTLQDLQTAMGGITPPSFYAAFGSKEALFLEAVGLYQRTVGEPGLRALEEGRTARAAIEAMMRETVAGFTVPGMPRGCLVIFGGTSCSNPTIQGHLQGLRQRAPEVIRRRLERGVRDGDVAAGLDLGAIAAFYATVLLGLGVRARDERSRAVLMSAVDGAMAAWPALTRPAPRRRRPARRRTAR